MQELVLDKNNYSSEKEFKEDLLNITLGLIKNDYTLETRWDDMGLGILVIQYDHLNDGLCEHKLVWMTPEDFEEYFAYKRMKREETEKADEKERSF